MGAHSHNPAKEALDLVEIVLVLQRVRADHREVRRCKLQLVILAVRCIRFLAMRGHRQDGVGVRNTP